MIAATGFRISFPFLDRSLVDFSSGPVPLYLRCFHPRLESLFFIGLFQPIGCIWPLAELQGQLVANPIVGHYRLPADLATRIAGGYIGALMDTPRTVHAHAPALDGGADNAPVPERRCSREMVAVERARLERTLALRRPASSDGGGYNSSTGRGSVEEALGVGEAELGADVGLGLASRSPSATV